MATGNGRDLLKIRDPKKRDQYLRQLEQQQKKKQLKTAKKPTKKKKKDKPKPFSKMSPLEKLQYRRQQTEDAFKLL